jgi:hypothetical protein
MILMDGKARFLPVGNTVIAWPEISRREEAKAENPAAGKPTAGLEEGLGDCLRANLGVQS